MPCVYIHRVFINSSNFGTHLLKNMYHHCNIADIGDIFNPAHILRQNRCGNDGDRGVFRSADVNSTMESFAAGYDYLFQARHILFSFLYKKGNSKTKGFHIVTHKIITLFFVFAKAFLNFCYFDKIEQNHSRLWLISTLPHPLLSFSCIWSPTALSGGDNGDDV